MPSHICIDYLGNLQSELEQKHIHGDSEVLTCSVRPALKDTGDINLSSLEQAQHLQEHEQETP